MMGLGGRIISKNVGKGADSSLEDIHLGDQCIANTSLGKVVLEGSLA